ncbi:hypothetical protein RBE51_18665 [Pseudomonas taiwanensis]|uniref:hypothetical protein n=1 Tax=Pseudomonas taiwanensis TaxID=470150 RepID=UPI0028DE74DE|nr:hypothetical protein [Pseudomonas taiwanensis]MDT8924817.1 hypothetical protein [Pseudomonas taiwanensis]
MNPKIKSFLDDRKFVRLWAPYPELESTVRASLEAVLESVVETATLSEQAMRFLSQELVGKALESTPLHQLEKVSYRIQETLRNVIRWGEQHYPDSSFVDARTHVNFFEGMEGYAQRLVESRHFDDLFKIIGVIQAQQVGQGRLDAVLVTDVLTHIGKTSDTQALDELVSGIAYHGKDIFAQYTPSLGNISNEMLMHTFRQVAAGNYDIASPDINRVVKCITQGVKENGYLDATAFSAKVMSIIEDSIADDCARASLLVDYNAVGAATEKVIPHELYGSGYVVENETARFFNPCRVLGHSVSAEIREIIEGRSATPWRSEAALNWCRTFNPDTLNLDHHVFLSLSQTPEVNNNGRLHSKFQGIFENIKSMSDQDFSGRYYESSWEDTHLRYEGPSGELFMQLLKDFTALNCHNGPKGNSAGQVLSPKVVSDVKRNPHLAEHFLHLWAMITACGYQSEARQYLAEFYTGSFKSLDFWIKHTGDSPLNYSSYEWFNEAKLQVDLGL